MTMKLRELIRAVRACKTAAEERALILKENALIRTSFREDIPYHHRNVAKLLYIHMLGYPTHFGQMVTLKLIAGGNFPEKRIGYLGLMLLLDETADVLMLVTNSLKQDMYSKNPYIVGLALCSLGNICSAEMARDLCAEVEKFFRHQSAYIRKKAALCAIRVIRKAPELIEEFDKSVVLLLNDKNHAVLITAVSLLIEMCRIDEKLVRQYRKLVPTIVRLLKNLVLAGYVSEYDVAGITDPFLQSRLIHLLRVLGTGDREASEFMTEILAQVAINTEPTKNPGNVILYETVQTIMTIEADSSTRVLAVNILGRFLANRDNNIRYVALQVLCKCVHRDTAAIQRHRNTVVECLKDSDISIRRRALDLIYALVTRSNVKTLAKELLTYLALTAGDAEFKADLTEKICQVVEKFAPSKLWHIDTVVQVLATAGNLTQENVSTDLILLISRSPALHAYAVHKLFAAVRKGSPHLPLIHVALWCIGEYGDLLVSKDGAAKAREADEGVAVEPVTERAVLDVLKAVQDSKDAQLLTREYLLNALIKLSTRLSAETADELKRMMADYEASVSIELQQRSCEYRVLTSDKLSKIRNGVVARMPVPTKQTKKQREAEQKEKEQKEKQDDMAKRNSKQSKSKLQESDDDDDDDEDDEDEDDDEAEEEEDAETAKKKAEIPKSNGKIVKKAPPPQSAKETNLLDLDIFRTPVATSPTPTAPFASSSTPSRPAVSDDLLSDIFGMSAAPSRPAAAPARHAAPAAADFATDPFAALSRPAPGAEVAPGPGAGRSPAASPASFFPSAPPSSSPGPTVPAASPVVSGSPPPSAPGLQTFPPATVFNKDGLSVTFQYSRNPANLAVMYVTALFSNHTRADFAAFDFQVAVAKTTKLDMQPASAAGIPAGSEGRVRQQLTLTNSLHGQKRLAIKVRITYTTEGRSVVEQATIAQFPD